MASVSAEPYAFEFDPRTTALVMIDFQRDFVDPGGFGEALGNDVSLLRRAVAPAARVLEAARAAGMLVVHTREGHRPDLSDCPPAQLARGRLPAGIGSAGAAGRVRRRAGPRARRARGRLDAGIGSPGPKGRILVRGEDGHDIVDAVAPLDGEVVLDKPDKGAFHATDLEQILRNHGVTHLVVTGVTTEVCVHTTVREANDRGFECLVLADCVGSSFPQFLEGGLRRISAPG